MAHTFTNLWFHVIFGTKGHSPSIASDVRAPLHGYIGGVVRELKGTAIGVNGTSDHIHALIKLPPTMPVADAMRVIKTIHQNGSTRRTVAAISRGSQAMRHSPSVSRG